MTARDLDTATDQLRPASYVRWVTNDMRADAANYLTRRGYEDLLPILGLTEQDTPEPRLRFCPTCELPIRGDRVACHRRSCTTKAAA